MSILRKSVIPLLLCMGMLLLGVLAAAPAQAEWGVKRFDAQLAANAGGGTFTQAGGHPYSFTTLVELNHHLDTDPTDIFVRFGAGQVPDGGILKDIIVDSPPGLVGNPAIVPHCSMAQLSGGGPINALGIGSEPTCPIDSQVGVISLKDQSNGPFRFFALGTFPVYNMVPPPNAPARFGFQLLGTTIVLDASIRNGGDFGVTVTSHDIAAAFRLWSAELTLWGVPADPSHDPQRCDYGEGGFFGECEGGSGSSSGPHHAGVPPRAFLTLPTSCPAEGAGLEMRARTDSWEHPDVFATASLMTHLPPYFAENGEVGAPQGTTDCGRVPFNPSISVQPTNHEADTPTGLDVEISLPQEGLLNPTGVATADVQKAVVTLPAGESISPSAADGLGACTSEEIGLTTGEPAKCPDSSKLGTVEVETPLLEQPLKGSIFLGKPECGPCKVADDLAGRMVKIYIVPEGSGVILKLAGRVELDPETGRIVTTFDDNPQLPFSHFRIDFKAGPRSPLVNPHTCGTYETVAQFTPWSGNPPVTVGDAFQITSGPEGKPCPTSSSQPFSPSFVAGTVNNQAGAFTPMQVTFSRGDGEQQLGRVSLNMAPGVLGSLAGLPLCAEPQASQGTCPAESQIGTLTVGAGAGANPFYVYGGKVYLTTAYKTGSFGLSIVVPAIAGPFNLGTVVVRGSVNVDPHTAELNVTTDPLPTILDGIPLDLRVVNVNVDRPRFVFNPTNCDPLSLTGTLTGGLGAAAPFGEPFQVTNCRILGFKPSFKVATDGKTSRANGASLDVTVRYPAGSMGKQANIARVKVELPKQLPSRLETLQKACPAEIFDKDPAQCPVASKIGTAVVHTQILPVQFAGPMYFVSHGGQAFPDLVIVLQGYGVTEYVVGTTFISKAGITSTTFNTVPDVPFESFELKLPQGRNSALAANGNLCTSRLRMPTLLIAQDGEVIRQSTPIAVHGCKAAVQVVKARGDAHEVTIVAQVPSGGTLSARGSGLQPARKRATHAGRVVVRLKLTSAERSFLSRRPGRRLKVHVHLSFSPRRGTATSGSAVVLVG
jgi:hypothetical protein